MKVNAFFPFSTLKKLSFLFVLCFAFGACELFEESDDMIDDEDPFESLFSTGWNNLDEDASTIPSDITFGNGNGSLPSSVDLTQHFPPIGDQGAFGTCVAWACAYNLKTSLEAMDKGYSKSELNSSSRQFSPTDLWQSIPTNQKGGDCGGTQFEPALGAMQERGVAPLADAPYSQLDCNAQSPSSWGNAAAGFKIDNFRKIDINVNEMKGYLANKRPIVVGAGLSDAFMQANNDDVLSANTTYNIVGQHAGHAIVVVGYDDGKGANGAFRIVNSWAANWGDAGLLWIDYNFFVQEFCFVAFVATNAKSDVDPSDPVDPTNAGGDVIPWNVSDEENYDLGPTGRSVFYNVYNIGQEDIPASADWNISYLFYNAYNADDFGIVLYDLYSDDFGSPGENGPLPNGVGDGFSGNWFNYVDLPSGSGVAEEVVGDDQFEWLYEMPDITGYYYLVLFADAYDDLEEGDESDNLFFIGDAFGNPLYIENGVVFGLTDGDDPDGFAAGKPTPQAKGQTPPHLRSTKNRNAYTPAEIRQFIKAEKQSGRLAQKQAEWLQHPTATKVVPSTEDD